MADASIIEHDVRSQIIRYHENEQLEEVYKKIQELTDD